MRKVVAAIVGIAIVAIFGYAHRDQVEARTNCGDKVVHQYTTTQVVPGAWGCLTPSLQEGLSMFYGISNAKEFAAALGTDGASYSYVGETKDGGYTYEVDLPIAKRTLGDEAKAVFSDIQNGNFSGAWAQLNAGTELYTSTVLTVYLYPSGSTSVDFKGNVTDISGELLTIQ